MNYSGIIIDELQKLENFSEKYKVELNYLSARIRMDLWKGGNEIVLASVLKDILENYDIVFEDREQFNINAILEIVRLLQEYSFFINSNVNKEYFIKLADDIEKEKELKKRRAQKKLHIFVAVQGIILLIICFVTAVFQFIHV